MSQLSQKSFPGGNWLAAFVEEAENTGYAPERSAAWERKISRALGGLMGLERENGNVVTPNIWLLFPLKLHGG